MKSSKDPKAEDRLENIDELVSAARQFDEDHPGATLADFLEDVSLASAVDRWDDACGAVAVMTLHAAKGLEFPYVFVLGIEEGILPHHRSRASPPQLEEERRLLFVGITRAQRSLHLSHCTRRTVRGQETFAVPSSFLRELPDEFIDFVDRTEDAYVGFRARVPRMVPPPRPRGFAERARALGSRRPDTGLQTGARRESRRLSSRCPGHASAAGPGADHRDRRRGTHAQRARRVYHGPRAHLRACEIGVASRGKGPGR